MLHRREVDGEFHLAGRARARHGVEVAPDGRAQAEDALQQRRAPAHAAADQQAEGVRGEMHADSAESGDLNQRNLGPTDSVLSILAQLLLLLRFKSPGYFS